MTIRTNLMPHPSCEVGSSLWITTNSTNEFSTDFAYAGTQSLKVSKTGATGASTSAYGTDPAIGTPNAQALPVTAGITYTFSHYVRTAVSGVSSRVGIVWMTDSAFISTSAGTMTTVAAGSWERRSVTATAPANATKASIQFDGTLPSGSVTYFDGFLFEQSATLGDYFDGSTSLTNYVTAWTGAAHDSTSTATLTLAADFSGEGTLTTTLTNYQQIDANFSGEGTLATYFLGLTVLDVDFTGEGTLTTDIPIDTDFSGEGTLSTVLTKTIVSRFLGRGTLSTYLTNYRQIDANLSGEGFLLTELDHTTPPPAIDSGPLGKLVGFTVNTAAVPVNPREGSGTTPGVNASYIKGTDPEFALGETNTLINGAIGTYEGEIVRLGLPGGSDRVNLSTQTPLTSLNTDLHLFPFIDGVPGTLTAARAIDYWTQQCGLFYDKVPGRCLAYASGYGHTESYGFEGNSVRFFEKVTAGTTTTSILNGRSVCTMGSAATGVTAFHDSPDTRVPVGFSLGEKLVFSIGLGLRGSSRTSTITWNFKDAQEVSHTVVLTATSAGAVSVKVGAVTVATASVTADGNYRITFSLAELSSTAISCKLTVHTDDLDGTGTLVHNGSLTAVSYALPTALWLTSYTHASSGGSGSQMLRWGTYLAVAADHPILHPAVQKTFSATGKSFQFVSGFEGNVWQMLNEYCSITRLEVRFLDARMVVAPRASALSLPGVTWSRFEVTSERREKYKKVAVVNRQSKAVTNGTGVLWKADSVYQLNTREVFETTVQTDHSILSVNNPVPVPGISPFPYTAGAGQYVVTGADGYIIAPQWWLDHGGKVEASLTSKEGEIAIKITAPGTDSVRAPYRISEGEADRPALYISGSGILNDPVEVEVSTGASNAREGYDNVFESPFISGLMETYDTAMAMAAEYSSGVAEVEFELPNTFDTATGLGQFPAGAIFTDNSRNYIIRDASQTQSKVSGTAMAHTTISDYVASYPAGATVADEIARHAGRTINQFNIKPLKGTS